MGIPKGLLEKEKMRVLKNLMEGDRVEITHVSGNSPMMLPVSICVYFVAWMVLDGSIAVTDKKYEGPLVASCTIAVKDIITITKLTPTR